ncbi:hypothetical protein FRC11_009861 [Ceratobasidium sp. 423]|nr:hypothetical protein FRC11_009861 [Ceratobasidium sp. 423]
MPYTLEESDIQPLLEYLDKIYASPPDNETLKEALELLKGMIETREESPRDEDDGEEVESEADKAKDRIIAMKEFIFTQKPDLLEYLLKFPDDKDEGVDEYTFSAKAESLAEILKGYSPLKASTIPFIDQLIVSLFREDLDDSPTHRAWALIARCPIVALLRPDPEARDAHAASGALDTLLTVIARGPLSPIGAVTAQNASINEACTALYQLMDNAKPEVLAQALIDRQAVGSPLKYMLDQIPSRPASDNDIEDFQTISKSKKYVPFFLAAIIPSASDNVLDAGISTAEQVGKITQLVEYACTQSAPDISPSMRVLRELILPSSDEDTRGWIDPEEELRRANKQFWGTFAQVVKTRLDAACALAPEVTTQKARDMVITEPSEVGLAHMKNFKVLVQLVEEQYTTIHMALLPNLAEYLQTLLLNASPLSRRSGLELLTAMIKESSLSKEFAFVPVLIEGHKFAVAYMLSDPRKLIRAMALEWLNCLTGYRHPEAEDYSRGDTEGSDEVKVAAEITQSMASRSTGTEAPESQDQDILEDIFLYGNVESASASALSALLDPLADLENIKEHIAPRITELADKDWFEFHSVAEKSPEVASLAI